MNTRPPTSVVKLSSELLEEIREIAKKENRLISQQVEVLVRAGLESRRKSK